MACKQGQVCEFEGNFGGIAASAKFSPALAQAGASFQAKRSTVVKVVIVIENTALQLSMWNMENLLHSFFIC